MKALLFAALIFAPATSQACWADVPLPKIIRDSPVMIRGKIISIAPAQTEFSFDRATIQVDEILKDESEKALKVGDQIILAMPSANPATATSIDLRYPLGTEGFWILEFKKGFYEATYPKDFQKIDARTWVIKALEDSKK